MLKTVQALAKRSKASMLRFWDGLSLNRKFTLLILGVLALPTIILFRISIFSMQLEERETVENYARSDLEKIQTFAYANSNTARAALQMIQSNPQLYEVLSTQPSTQELLAFHQEVTTYLESISATNNYIRSVRIYTDEISERYPVFIQSSRVSEEAWFRSATEDYYRMRVNYQESLSQQISQYTGSSLLSFYQELPLPHDNKTVIEVSFHLADFFGEIYSSQSNGICYIKVNESIFTAQGNNLSTTQQLEQMMLVRRYGTDCLEESLYFNNGKNYLLTGKYCPDLDVYYYLVSDLSQEKSYQYQVNGILIIIAVFLLFSYVFDNIAKMLHRRIYETVHAMQQIELGNTLVQIENPASDEIGVLQKYFNQMVLRIDNLIEKESQRAILEKDAELKALQNQINSHFLYNVLNNIEMMAIIDENFLIADTITALARLLRYSMKWEHQIVPLYKELDYVRDYVQLFNMRFDNEIGLIFDIPPEQMNAMIPKMSVQPVVENAIVHGIEDRLSDEIIRIATQVNGDVLYIGITDTGLGISNQALEKLRSSLKSGNGNTQGTASGIGLNNVQERIVKQFGSEFGIKIQSKQGEYTKVTLSMPYMTQEVEA